MGEKMTLERCKQGEADLEASCPGAAQGEAVYQQSLSGGHWLDTTEEAYERMREQYPGKVRKLYPAPPAAALTDEMVERALRAMEPTRDWSKPDTGFPSRKYKMDGMRHALQAALSAPAERSIPVSKVREMLVKAYCNGWIGFDSQLSCGQFAPTQADRILAAAKGE